jgi:uncharacterized protein YjiS (DUF1127 family)
MQFNWLKQMVVSSTQFAILRLREIRQARRAYLDLKDLPSYLLKDIGLDRNALDQKQNANSVDYFRS